MPLLESELVRASISLLNRFDTSDLKPRVNYDRVLRWIQAKAPILPNWEDIAREIQTHHHLTLQLLWFEYKEQNPNGLSYSRFCARYRQSSTFISSWFSLKLLSSRLCGNYEVVGPLLRRLWLDRREYCAKSRREVVK